VAREFLCVRHCVDPAARRVIQLAPCHVRIAGELIRRAKQQRGHLQACLGEQPRRHHAIAAIVAATAQHRHAPRLGELLPRKGRNGPGGRPHQLNGRNSKPLRGGAVAGLHLGCG